MNGKLRFERGVGCGRYRVHLGDVHLGDVFRTRRYGYSYWKISGSGARGALFTTRRDAAESLRDRAPLRLRRPHDESPYIESGPDHEGIPTLALIRKIEDRLWPRGGEILVLENTGVDQACVVLALNLWKWRRS